MQSAKHEEKLNLSQMISGEPVSPMTNMLNMGVDHRRRVSADVQMPPARNFNQNEF